MLSSLSFSSLRPSSITPSTAPQPTTMATTSPTPTSTDDTCRCKNCGIPFTVLSEADYPREARLRIEELEQQVKEFSVRAVMAAERLAQAQKEVYDLRRKSESSNSTTGSIVPINTAAAAAAPVPQNTPLSPLKRSNTVTTTLQNMSKVSTQKLNSFFYRTALPPTTELPPPVERPPTPPEPLSRASMDSQVLDDLSNALCSERRSREVAEKQLAQVKNEVEELSASLFQQANDMVADERRSRAKLEERVKILEKRDAEKRVRLEKLEKGITRIIKARDLINNKDIPAKA
ncbi:hypothetical protein TWF102_010216 [Orbilia oligospora]|uniref:GDP/GTP exchange factor Sec2 N-terminal domain-containing protein n=1 Tax=Orbilia oligospora TaxID=2813651 RepID=A0A7C8NB57_ORBOL|nr:hypothetical protein TWF102_010216 [Orbilia oligospora]KAF3093837.1 hypothetical protein TWF103_010706 [Orbilia oligospora]KAF3093838.1 hypothetical protein TWF103_010706 [Orbilia oligospora]KAF3105722.1 hypothetical protein TWF706_003819 [Orbilia oligospora]KAF3105723.1 hypothetical protein TWF706_003819 [Orbilia oligospora]